MLLKFHVMQVHTKIYTQVTLLIMIKHYEKHKYACIGEWVKEYMVYTSSKIVLKHENYKIFGLCKI